MAGSADLPDGDGSMETILASIRRIIREDESTAVQPLEPSVASAEEEDELLVLEPSMMLQQHPLEEARMTAGSHQPSAAQSAAALAAALFDDPEPPPPRPQPAVVAAPVPAVPVPVVPAPPELSPYPTRSLLDEPEDDTLLAPQTRVATAQAFAALQNAIKPEPTAASEMRVARSGGLTLEDIARDEVRGQLKAWLDANLPELVERVVRQEIERLVRPG